MARLLVGEDNPGSLDPDWALWPDPVNCAGWRLCHRILGYRSKRDYLRTWERRNLCLNTWNKTEAIREASLILANPSYELIVALGSKVSKSFGLEFKPFCLVRATRPGIKDGHLVEEVIGPPMVILPHPSGRCREWNDPSSYERARNVLRLAGADLP